MSTKLADENGNELTVGLSRFGEVQIKSKPKPKPVPETTGLLSSGDGNEIEGDKRSKEGEGNKTSATEDDDEEDDEEDQEQWFWELSKRDAEELSCTEHYSLYMFSPAGLFRQACFSFAKNKWFDRSILVLIAVSSILLAIDEPRLEECKDLPTSDPDSCMGLVNVLFWLDAGITAVFVLEMVVKIIALGFVLGPRAYLRSSWNILDFVIVIISLLSLSIGGDGQLKALKSLRALRALRPLRVIARNPGLRLVVNAIFGSLPKVSNVALVNFLFFLVFAVIGGQNFMGSLNSCNDDSVEEKTQCVGSYNATGDGCMQLPTAEEVETCQTLPGGAQFPRVWGPPPFHFDNVLNSLLTVWEVATGEMWPDIMYVAVDAVGPDQPLERDNNPAAALYFLAINVVFAFFMLEIFTGIVIENFNRIKEEASGSALLTDTQRQWLASTKLLMSVNPVQAVLAPPRNGFDWIDWTRKQCYDIA